MLMKMNAILFLVALSFYSANGAEFRIVNKASEALWIGIQGNNGVAPLAGGGFILAAGATRSLTSTDTWAGRFWARTGCNAATNHCETGDCGNKLTCGGNGGEPPASLAEFTLKGWGGLDYYDVSLVDGFNVPASIEPIGGTGDGTQYSCKKCACAFNLNSACPTELQLKGAKGTVGCKSACMVFNTDEYCCRGAHGTPDACKSSDWKVNYPKYFKDHCPDAYSYAYDDHKSTFTCKSSIYVITFG